MRAAYYDETGPARSVLKVANLDRPTPGPGEVLVRIRASGVNPSDYKRRAGWRGLRMEHPRIIPHSDGAGEIEAVGRGVPRSRVGERVWLWNAQGRDSPFGTAAEYCAVPSDRAPLLPAPADWAEGACLGVAACTAHYALFADGPLDGATVLVAGGAGAVGHYAIQLAAFAGAEVLTTVSSSAKAEHADAAGADYIIDYTADDTAARILDHTDGRGVDRIVEVDFGANAELDAAVIRPNGTIASYSSTRVPEPRLPYYRFAAHDVRLHFVQGYLLPPSNRRHAVRDIETLLRERRLHGTVAARFPLDQVADAHALAERGDSIGKAILDVD